MRRAMHFLGRPRSPPGVLDAGIRTPLNSADVPRGDNGHNSYVRPREQQLERCGQMRMVSIYDKEMVRLQDSNNSSTRLNSRQSFCFDGRQAPIEAP